MRRELKNLRRIAEALKKRALKNVLFNLPKIKNDFLKI
jgi:hypothetical protein